MLCFMQSSQNNTWQGAAAAAATAAAAAASTAHLSLKSPPTIVGRYFFEVAGD